MLSYHLITILSIVSASSVISTGTESTTLEKRFGHLSNTPAYNVLRNTIDSNGFSVVNSVFRRGKSKSGSRSKSSKSRSKPRSSKSGRSSSKGSSRGSRSSGRSSSKRGSGKSRNSGGGGRRKQPGGSRNSGGRGSKGRGGTSKSKGNAKQSSSFFNKNKVKAALGSYAKQVFTGVVKDFTKRH